MAVQRALKQVLLHLITAVHLRPRQVAWRARYALRRRIRGFPVPPVPADAPVFDAACLARLRALLERWARLAPPDEARLEGFRQGRFTFSGETVESDGSPPWHADGPSRLWQYEIHYCAFLRDLALAYLLKPDTRDRDLALAWLHDWMASNPPGPGVAWEAYPTAARLMNWALAESVFGFDEPGMRKSFARQAVHLASHLEWHIGGNHLLQNAAGLTVAGAVLGAAWEARGAVILRKAVATQVLRDGGHAERSPMYHARVMLDLLVARAASPARVSVDAALARMADFLQQILHDDGDLPQFGDSARGEYPSPVALIELVPEKTTRRTGALSLADSGIYVMAVDGNSARLIVKASPPGMACQPGHAHSDALSYELTFHGERVVVDTGVHGYDGSPIRDYCRSTAAHNTVQAGGIEQMRFWKTFRVAQRYVTENCKLEATREGVHFSGGCKVGSCYRHVRNIRLPADARGGLLLAVHDRLSGRLAGLPIRSYVHLHPNWRAEVDGPTATVRHGDAALRFVADGAGLAWEIRRGAMPPVWTPRWRGASRVREISNCPEEGWYCASFGMVRPADVLVLHGLASASAKTFDLGYLVLECSESLHD